MRQPLPEGCVPIVLGQVLDGMTSQDNGAFWALGLEAAIPESGTAVELVGAFDPSPFGFGAHCRAQRPADFALPTPVDP